MVAFSSKITNYVAAEAGCENISYHDYRRTFSTGLEELGVPHRVISLTEGHLNRGIEVHYQQGKQKPLDDQLAAYRKWEALLGVRV